HDAQASVRGVLDGPGTHTGRHEVVVVAPVAPAEVLVGRIKENCTRLALVAQNTGGQYPRPVAAADDHFTQFGLEAPEVAENLLPRTVKTSLCPALRRTEVDAFEAVGFGKATNTAARSAHREPLRQNTAAAVDFDLAAVGRGSALLTVAPAVADP